MEQRKHVTLWVLLLALPWWISCMDASTKAPAASTSPSPSDAVAAIQDRGRLTAVSFPHQANRFVHPQLEKLREAGVSLVDAKSADFYDGFEVALLNGFAEHLGVALEVEAVTTSYAEIIDTLLAGKGDLIASGLTMTDARAARVDFSAPYAESWVCVVARVGTTIGAVEDLVGKTGAVMRGSSHQELIQQRAPEGVALKLNDFKLENLIDVKEGLADFLLLDSVVAPGEVLKADPALQVAIRLEPFGYRVAFPPGSNLRLAFDRYVAELAAAGGIQTLLERYPLE